MSHQIYDLIPKVMGDIGAVSKDRKNEQQKYSFRGIEDFYQAAHPAFVKHGIFCVPEVIDHASTAFDKTNEFGKVTTWRHVTIKVKHQFFAPDGSHVDVVTMGEGLDSSDKATNKAMSGAMKYALIELFTVPTQDVEDADRTSPETGKPTKPVARTTEPVAVRPIKAAEPSPSITTVKGEQGEAPKTAREPGDDDEADALIDLPRQRALHRDFRSAIRNPEAQKQADVWLQDWLKNQGYVGADGKGTTRTIPMSLFLEVKESAVRYATQMPA